MGYIDIKHVQAVKERLLGQISILQNLQEELKQTEQKIKDMAYMEETLYLLRKSRKEAEEEIHTLSCFAQCLEEAAGICKKTEQRIADVYNLDVIAYPKSIFRTSYISGLEANRHLLTFQTKQPLRQ